MHYQLAVALHNIKEVKRLASISDEAREAQRAYFREWRKKNPDKIREKNRRYWEKKAEKAKQEEQQDDTE